MPNVIKADGSREIFADQKLRAGMQRSLEKRPVSVEDIEAAVNNIKRSLFTSGEREVPARQIGEYVMEELRKLDHVAYLRFASGTAAFRMYMSFAR